MRKESSYSLKLNHSQAKTLFNQDINKKSNTKERLEILAQKTNGTQTVHPKPINT